MSVVAQLWTRRLE